MKTRSIIISIVGLVIIGVSTYVLLWRQGSDTAPKMVSAAYFPLIDITNGPVISFNFDDGFASAYKVGMPILDSAGFKTTHYIIINRIGEKGYMSSRQILELQTKGHEIGAHTLTHPKLTELSLSKAHDEIFKSKEKLMSKGVLRVDTFAYPNGDFNENVVNLVKEAGFSGARITNPGLNDKDTNPYELLYLGINSEVTFEMVKQKIDEAISHKKWLIMVFHRVGETGYENVSKELLQQIVSYVKENKVPVVTTAQGLYIVKNITH